MPPKLTIYTEAAEQFGVTAVTISNLVSALGITPKPTGRPGKSRGLDRDDMRLIRRALSVGKKAKPPAKSATSSA